MILTIKIGELKMSELAPRLKEIVLQIEQGYQEGWHWEIKEEPKPKKPVCPKCKQEIDELVCVVTGRETSRLLVPYGNPQYDNHKFSADGDELLYNCPACNETLFLDNEEAAIRFLEGEE